MSLPNVNIGGLPTKGSIKPLDKFAVFDKDVNITYGETHQTLEKYLSGLKKYTPQTFYAKEVFVLRENVDGWAIYELVNAVRPFVSSDFDVELLAGSWEFRIGEGSGVFDWNRTITTMPAVGQFVGGTTINEGLENMFFGVVAPSGSLSIVLNPREKTGAANVDVSVGFSVVKNTNPITSITIDGVSVTPTGNSQSGTQLINIPSNVDKTIDLIVSDGENQGTSSIVQRFLSGVRIGSTTKNGTTDPITSADINTLPIELRADRFASRTGFNSNGLYTIITYPATYGDAVILINGLPNSAWQRFTQSFTNSLGFTEDTMVIVSNTVQSGSTSIQIT